MFKQRHWSDGWFWALVWLYCVATIWIAFDGPVSHRFFDGPYRPATWTLIIHVWTAAAWIGLWGIQALLATCQRMALHRKLGIAMLPLAGLLVVTAAGSEILLHYKGEAIGIDTSPFLAIQAFTLTIFITVVALAWRYRTKGTVHKRLILVASASLMSAVELRIWGPLIPRELWVDTIALKAVFYFGGAMIIILAGVLHDLLSRGRVHRTYLLALAALIPTYLLASVFHGSEWWSAAMQRLL